MKAYCQNTTQPKHNEYQIAATLQLFSSLNEGSHGAAEASDLCFD